jgi:hypothetical protein
MAFGTTTANAILALIFNATPGRTTPTMPRRRRRPTSRPRCTPPIPACGGTQTTSESAYTNYARQNVARTTSGFSLQSSGATALVANLDFPSSGASGTTITYGSFGKTGGGATAILVSGAITPNISIPSRA